MEDNSRITPKDKWRQRYITVGMGIGLTIVSSMGTHRFYPHFDGQIPKFETVFVFNGIPGWIPESFQPDLLDVDPAIQEILSEMKNVPHLIAQINKWIGLHHNLSTEVSTEGMVVQKRQKIKKILLNPFMINLDNRERMRIFKLRGSDRLVCKLRVFYVSGEKWERCLLVDLNHSSREIGLVQTLPLSQILCTDKGLFIIRETRLMIATAYYPGPECTGGSCDGITSTGKIAGKGIVAVDPKVIPLGSLLYIEGYGIAEAADVGAAIKGNRIDLCFETYHEAVNYGRKSIKVSVIE